MSKTKNVGQKRSVTSWFMAYSICAIAVAVYMEGRIPLAMRFYIKTLFISTAVFITGMLIRHAIRRGCLAGASMKKIDNMSGEEFEQYLGILYSRKGYKVEYTPGTMDFGADLILTKGKVKTIVQAKRYRNSVGEAAVQQVLAAKGYYNADQCLVVTNSGFTAAARELAAKTDVKLIGRDKLGKSAMFI